MRLTDHRGGMGSRTCQTGQDPRSTPPVHKTVAPNVAQGSTSTASLRVQWRLLPEIHLQLPGPWGLLTSISAYPHYSAKQSASDGRSDLPSCENDRSSVRAARRAA